MYQYHQSKYWYTGTLIYSDLPYYLCSRDEVHPKCYLSDVGLMSRPTLRTRIPKLAYMAYYTGGFALNFPGTAVPKNIYIAKLG